MGEESIDLIAYMLEREAELSAMYPIEATYGSKCSLWTCGLNHGAASRDLYSIAKAYYGDSWNCMNN